MAARQKTRAPAKAAPPVVILEETAGSCLSPPPEHAALVRALLDWFAAHRRSLPWRERTDAYAVWVSEIMLQQTQVDRVIPYFTRFLRLFPDVQSLAAATEEELLKAWEGLGYYSRARNLQKTARLLLAEHGGRLPPDRAALLALPGIGPYTAGAILSLAFNLPEAAVDGNVERVFSRLFDIDSPVKSVAATDFIRHMAAALIPPGRAGDFNQALMELGALVCVKKARCGICPLARFCRALDLGIVHERPVPGRRVRMSALEIVSGVLVHRGRVFVQKRPDSGVWAGFWEFPGGRLETGESPAEGVAREFFEETEFRVRPVRPLGLVRHGYTRYSIAMHCFLCALEDAPPHLPEPVLHAATRYRWAKPGELDALVLPAGHRKLLLTWADDIARAAKNR